MGRPRVLNFQEGVVELINFSKDKADAIEAHIFNFGKEAVPLPASNAAINPEAGIDCTETTLGLRHNLESKRWELITTKVNPITRQAKVTEIADAGENKAVAVGHLKMAMYKNGIV